MRVFVLTRYSAFLCLSLLPGLPSAATHKRRLGSSPLAAPQPQELGNASCLTSVNEENVTGADTDGLLVQSSIEPAAANGSGAGEGSIGTDASSQAAQQATGGQSVYKPVKRLYLIILMLSLVAQMLTVWMGRFDQAPRRAKDEQALGAALCEFFEFKRPAPETVHADFFRAAACPPAPVGTLQPAYALSRSNVYHVVAQVVPASSVRFAVLIGMNTASLWIALHVATTTGLLQKEFLNYSDQDTTSAASFNFWALSINDLSTIGNLLKVMLAFLLMTMVRQRMNWLDTLKSTVWQVKMKGELLSFMLGGILSGDSLTLQRARFDMHRWLVASVFFCFRDASPYLQRYNIHDLVQSGVLSEEERNCIGRVAEDLDHRATDVSFSCRGVGGGAVSHQLAACPHRAKSKHSFSHMNSKARDCLLWWIKMRIRTSVNEGLMDKKTMKKALAGVWSLRDAMEGMSLEASRRPMFLWSVLMQIMVDAYVALVPVGTLQEVYHKHVWLLPWAMLRSFVVAFFYDALLQIVALLWEPFGTHVDRLNLDAVAVAIERSTFANLSRLEGSDLPEKLRQTWHDSLAQSKDKSGKDGKVGKAAKDDDDDD